MIKREWKKLLHNKILLIVLIAIIAIPTIYTTLFLGSMWDPYGNLDKLPVAVVNNDQPAQYNGKTMDIGTNLVENLKEDSSLAFNFVDSETAVQGLKNGTFYMVITIPEDFSQKATTLMDQTPEKMHLDYETNPGTNYIASKMSDTALQKIEESISKEVTKEYTRTVFEQISESGDGIAEAADGAGELEDGIKTAKDGNATISINLKTLADSSLTFKSGSDELNEGILQYTDGVSKVDDGARQLHEGVDTLSHSASSGTSQLADGASELSNGITAYTDGVSRAADGADTLNDQSNALKSGVSQISSGVSELKTGADTLLTGVSSMSREIGDTLPDQNTIDALSGGLTTYQQSIGQINAGLQNFTIPDTSEVAQAGAILQDALSNAGADTGNIAAALATLTADMSNLTPEQQQAVGALAQNAGNLSQHLTDAGSAAQSVSNALGSLQGSLGALNELKAGVSALNENADAVLGGSITAVSGMYQGLSTVKGALDEQIIPGVTAIDSGLEEVQNGVDSDLANGITAYTDGVSEVNKGLKELSSNSETLKSGSGDLKSGVSELASGLSAGVEQLKDGTGSLYSGTQELCSNSSSLISGSGQLNSGAAQISDGAGQLYDGSKTLGSGMEQLEEGSNTLKTSLKDGADQVKENSAGDGTFDMFSSPVITEKTELTEVANNGHAMAPYMMSVALWVGCIAFCIMYPLTDYNGRLKSGVSWWLSKATVVTVIAVAQALAMISLLHVFNGFSPVEMGKTILLACLASMTFMSIMYFFNICFGKVGSFAMLIFMVVQLAGSAGTYPVEISGSFVASIHKFLPFTYTVDGFRSTIAGGTSITKECLILLALLLIFTICTVLIFQFRTRRIRAGKKCILDFMEKKGLA
ncbi:YhgE/Pip domain-containing protein [Ruminococcus sp. OA3]|uniref:YhgE/Pip domain-containing protein n=1 Tax=Ruminococcus sp. OA3 TaxID=2914164 RepID=UPI001F060D13|nr:YhgE/Pip domain-containing protein [Ruminococcus sp. OA3]MCH1983503.1 YhgE/Pip domain-containing protein [Ruminococcus sp. OA3]